MPSRKGQPSRQATGGIATKEQSKPHGRPSLHWSSIPVHTEGRMLAKMYHTDKDISALPQPQMVNSARLYPCPSRWPTPRSSCHRPVCLSEGYAQPQRSADPVPALPPTSLCPPSRALPPPVAVGVSAEVRKRTPLGVEGVQGAERVLYHTSTPPPLPPPAPHTAATTVSAASFIPALPQPRSYAFAEAAVAAARAAVDSANDASAAAARRAAIAALACVSG